MKPFLYICLLLGLSCTAAFAQHGTAENGYYPYTYHGETWTGVVTDRNDDTREVTLAYNHGSKTETFVGVLQEGYLVKPKDGAVVELKPSNIQPGATLTVYYQRDKVKVHGQKVNANVILLIKGFPNHKLVNTTYMVF